MPDYKKLYRQLYIGVSSLLAASEPDMPRDVLKDASTIIKIHRGKEGIHSEIVAVLADGLTDRDVGKKLEKSQRTIEGYVYRMCQLYRVNNRVQLVAKFLRNSWIK